MTFEKSYQIWRWNRSGYKIVHPDTPEERELFLQKVCKGNPRYAVDNVNLWDFGRRDIPVGAEGLQ